MTNKEAKRILQFCIPMKTDKQREAINLAIKALEVVDDVNHTVYRNENCKKAGRCYDYIGYHCAGCNGE